MIEDIRTIRVFKSIPIKVYEEIKVEPWEQAPWWLGEIEWVDVNGINTPYLISWI